MRASTVKKSTVKSSGEKVRCIFRKVLIAHFVFAIFQIFWKGANVGFREVINEQNLVNSPKWEPENKSDKKGRKDIGGEMDGCATS